ncbi:MAG TPA: family 1 glycosylhydrolase [Myxococcota bacterium]|nr:family 1 glycosylhydrolase [Myxococcota bacterium]
MRLRRSELARLSEPDAFAWLAGIEDTFISAPSAKTGRTLDEYDLTEHSLRWRDDLALFAELGVRAVRYGIPWHRINPAPGVWDFAAADGPLERLLALGIEPIVDLVHYGVPSWIDGAFLHPRYDAYVAEYAARVAERYQGRIHAYTPLNEPRVTAWYCGKLGWWPPQQRGWRGFTRVMLGVCRGIVATTRALRAVDPEIVAVHVEATDLYDAMQPEVEDEAALRQELVFCALDLVSGKLREGHPLFAWALAHGASAEEIEWFAAHALELDLVGINLYPLFSQKRVIRTKRGLRIRMSYAMPEIVERLGEMYSERYARPLWISETASRGSVRRRRAWLEGSVAAVRKLRARGVPLVGYTWWPLFSLVGWAYREGKKPVHDYLHPMGLWDLVPGERGLERVRTPLVDAYRELVSGGAAAVGRLARSEPPVESLESPTSRR